MKSLKSDLTKNKTAPILRLLAAQIEKAESGEITELEVPAFVFCLADLNGVDVFATHNTPQDAYCILGQMEQRKLLILDGM